ncbi:MAG: hypothetical protein HZC41_17670 [Chloroflexi bacterium]|nr:hypothetical protein [Chloroflexota bacterium]
MSVDSFIHAIPKVELNLQFEGALRKDTLLMIAEQNDIPGTIKNFQQWLALLERPDYKRLDEMVRAVSQWLQLPENLTRLVYEMGVALAKQNVRYAEVSINPTLYMEQGLTFEQLLTAINDGRDRVTRGWGVQIRWILTIPRDQPRKADDYLRWATSTSARKGGVLGIGLGGPENAQPIGQFERPFRSAEKKELHRVALAGDELGAEGIIEAVTHLQPDRIYRGWGVAESPEALRLLDEQHIPLVLALAHEVRTGRISSYADYPLRRLLDEGLTVTLTSGMPELYQTTLVQEYLAAVEQIGVGLTDVEEMALNSVRASLLPDDEKQTMLDQFTQEYARLRAEHITPETT